MVDSLDFTYGGQSVKQLLEARGLLFNISSISGDELLGPSVETTNRPGGDGSRLVSSSLPERVVSVDYDIATLMDATSDSLEVQAEASQAMGGVLHRPGVHELRLSYLDGYYLAKTSGLSASSRRMNLMSGTIEFVCPSPFLHGSELVTYPSNGLVEVSTNYFVEPLILWTLDDAHGAPYIEVDGQRLTIDTQVSSGQQIRVDCARKEVRVGGVLNVEDIRGVFPRLRDRSTFNTSPGGTVEIQYQERWI